MRAEHATSMEPTTRRLDAGKYLFGYLFRPVLQGSFESLMSALFVVDALGDGLVGGTPQLTGRRRSSGAR